MLPSAQELMGFGAESEEDDSHEAWRAADDGESEDDHPDADEFYAQILKARMMRQERRRSTSSLNSPGLRPSNPTTPMLGSPLMLSGSSTPAKTLSPLRASRPTLPHAGIILDDAADVSEEQGPVTQHLQHSLTLDEGIPYRPSRPHRRVFRQPEEEIEEEDAFEEAGIPPFNAAEPASPHRRDSKKVQELFEAFEGEVSTLDPEELHLLFDSLKDTYSVLRANSDSESQHQAEIILRKLKMIEEMFATAMTQEVPTPKSKGHSASNSIEQGERKPRLEDFGRRQPLTPQALVPVKEKTQERPILDELIEKEREAAAAVLKATGDLDALRRVTQDKNNEIQMKLAEVEKMKRMAQEKFEKLRKVQLQAERLRGEVRDLTIPNTAIDMDRAQQAGFTCDISSGKFLFVSPRGPMMLVSMPQSVGFMRWKLRCDGNSSFAIGLIPENALNDQEYLFTKGKIGINSAGTTKPCKLLRMDCFQRWIEVVVDIDNGTVQFVLFQEQEGEEEGIPKTQRFTAEGEPVRLAVCTWKDCLVELNSA